MAVIPAVVTLGDAALGGRSAWPQMIGGAHLLALATINGGFFRIGQGGHTAGVPDTPDPVRDDIDDTTTFFQKSLAAGDVTYTAPTTLEIAILLDFGEGNGGGSRTYYELGIYDSSGRLVVYGTFAAQVKTAGVQLSDTVRVTF